MARVRKIPDWREIAPVAPKKLPEGLVELVGLAYQSGANIYTERNFFDTPNMDYILEEIYSNFKLR